MIIVGELKGIVISSAIREFDTKPTPEKPSKHFKLVEVTFFAPERNFTGVLKDWECSIEPSSLPSGASIVVAYNKCAPSKGMQGVFDFTGFAKLVK